MWCAVLCCGVFGGDWLRRCGYWRRASVFDIEGSNDRQCFDFKFFLILLNKVM